MLEPGENVDRYTVEEILGQGGMAVVYRVRHNQLDSLHALKILTITNPGIKDRLLQEGKVQASLRHPNIVAVTDVLEVRGAPGLVMEFIEGPGLDAWLEEHEPTVEQAVSLFEGICRGVAHAHDKGVIHRDLKPANVMMAPASGMWMPKVADFGLAKAVSEDGSMQKTRSGVTMGTPQYMAPEQIRDAKNVDERADVFSLGCILYELVCGRPPFVGPDILSIFNAVASGNFPAAVSLVPDLPAEVRDAIEGSLVVDRDNRIHSVHALLEVLRGAPLPESIASASQERIRRSGESQHTWAPDVGVAVAASSSTRASRPSEPGTGTIDPGSAPSLSPGGKGGRRALLMGGGLVALGLVGALAIAGLAGGAFFAGRSVESGIHAAITAQSDLSVGDVSLGPTGLVLTDFAVGGPGGEPALSARSVRFEASPAAFRGGEWAVDRVVISGLDGTLSRGVDGRFHLTGATEALLRKGGAAFGLSARELVIEEGSIALESGGDALRVEWDGARLGELDLDLRSGLEWSATSAGVRGLDVGAADPLLRVGELRVEAGRAEASGLELWVRGRTDGMLDLPPVIADEIADWAGGTRHQPESRDWLGIDLSGLPVPIAELHASSGALHLTERAHGVKTAAWDVALDRVAIGPIVGDRAPVGLSGALGDGRITIDGDVARDGLIRLHMAGRYLPVSLFEPYIAPSLDKYDVALDGGSLDVEVALTAQGHTLAAAVDLTGESLAFTADGSPGRRGRRLLEPRAKAEASRVVEGNLADQDLTPVGQSLDLLLDLLFAPAGGAIEDAAQKAERDRLRAARERELAEARAAAAAEPEPEPTTTTAPSPAPAGETMGRGGTEPAPRTEEEPAAREGDEEDKPDASEVFQRVNRGVRDALEDFKIGRDR